LPFLQEGFKSNSLFSVGCFTVDISTFIWFFLFGSSSELGVVVISIDVLFMTFFTSAVTVLDTHCFNSTSITALWVLLVCERSSTESAITGSLRTSLGCSTGGIVVSVFKLITSGNVTTFTVSNKPASSLVSVIIFIEAVSVSTNDSGKFLLFSSSMFLCVVFL